MVGLFTTAMVVSTYICARWLLPSRSVADNTSQVTPLETGVTVPFTLALIISVFPEIHSTLDS